MRRARAIVALAALPVGLLAATATRATEEGRFAFEGAVDVAALHADTDLRSWLSHGEGKLRFDHEQDGLHFERAFLDYRVQLLDTVSLRGTLNAQDGVSVPIDLTEAFIDWRPVPSHGWKLRTRGGVFYPRLSVENTAAGWSTPYTLSSSAINTWIAEELRTVGVESRLSHDVPFLPTGSAVAFEGAVFYANDPTGAVLQGRGWAIHDRQTGLFGSVPLPPVLAIESWEFTPPERSKVTPYRELDGHAGFYGGAELRVADVVTLKAMHYDNHANPDVQVGGQYAWQMWFDHVSAAADLPGGVGVLGQWIKGSSRAGEDLGPWRVFDADFTTWFALLTKAWDRHRVSVRYDNFDTRPFDDPDNYVNQDTGHGWTLAWLWDWTRHLRVGAEYLGIVTRHCHVATCAWVSQGLPEVTREESIQLQLRWQFGD